MALASTRMQVISGGKGQSAVASAAYRSGEKLYDEKDGQWKEYNERKDRVVYTEILLPENAPKSFSDRQTLWNAAQNAEPQKNARYARDIYFALQRELTQEQNVEIARKVAQYFREQGMAVDFAVHDSRNGNPHTHLMATMRPFNEDGSFGSKGRKVYILDEHGERIKLPSGGYKSTKVRTTDWDDKENAKKWRDAIEKITNQVLEKYGHEQRIDMGSYRERGIDKTPTEHLGYKSHQLEQQGIETIRGNRNRTIEQENREREAIKKELAELEQQRKYLQEIEQMKAQRQEKVKEHYYKGGKARAKARQDIPLQNPRTVSNEQKTRLERIIQERKEMQEQERKRQENKAEFNKQLTENYQEQPVQEKKLTPYEEFERKVAEHDRQQRETHKPLPKKRENQTFEDYIKEVQEHERQERERRGIDREQDHGRER